MDYHLHLDYRRDGFVTDLDGGAMMDPTDNAMMLDIEDQIICRRRLDQERKNEWICQCGQCQKEKGEKSK